MDFKGYLISKIEDNEHSQGILKDCIQGNSKTLEKLKEEHAILEALLKETEPASQITDDSGKASESQQEELGIDMSPKGFNAFIKAWVMAHLKDERLCPGYVERMFNTATEMYKSKRVSLDSVRTKRGLTDWEEFRRKNGLYSADIYNQYWVDRFKEIYGYTPELPG